MCKKMRNRSIRVPPYQHPHVRKVTYCVCRKFHRLLRQFSVAFFAFSFVISVVQYVLFSGFQGALCFIPSEIRTRSIPDGIASGFIPIQTYPPRMRLSVPSKPPVKYPDQLPIGVTGLDKWPHNAFSNY